MLQHRVSECGSWKRGEICVQTDAAFSADPRARALTRIASSRDRGSARRVILCDIKRAAFVRVCSFLMKTFSPCTNNRARFPRKPPLAATDAIPRIDLFTTFTIKKRNSRRRPSSESISSSEILFCSSPGDDDSLS